MKECVSQIILSLLVGIYIISTMGYGIHKCSHDGTKSMIILYGETPCEHSHSLSESVVKGGKCTACCCCNHVANSPEDSHEHSENCCSTEVYVLSHDQVNSQQAEVCLPSCSILYLPAEYTFGTQEITRQMSFSGVVYSSGFTKSKALSDLCTAISQFRI